MCLQMLIQNGLTARHCNFKAYWFAQTKIITVKVTDNELGYIEQNIQSQITFLQHKTARL